MTPSLSRTSQLIEKQLLGNSHRPWWMRFLFPFTLTPRQLACLGLIGTRYPKRGVPNEWLFGVWPVLCAIGLLIWNQYFPLIAFPKFLRAPLIIAYGLSCFDARELTAASQQGQTSVGVSVARSVFPISIWDIFTSLWCNRLLFLWVSLPGWLLSVGILLMTDLPRMMILNVPLIMAILSLLVPFASTLALVSSNLRSTLRLWLFLILPSSIVGLALILLLQFGVFGYLFAMRPDAAWPFVGFLAMGLITLCLGFLKAISVFRLDAGTQALGAELRWFGR